jgi:chromosome segregation ATPase
MLSSLVTAQEPIRQDTQATPRQTKPIKPAPEPVDKTIQTTPILEPNDQMTRALTSLSTQISVLTDELKRLRRETERNAGMMELLLNEDRLARVEDKVQAAQDYKAQLDIREQDFLRRQKNIQVEVVMRGGLRRDEAEAAIKAELQRGLEDTRNQQLIYQQRIAELNEQATKLRARIDKLRKKMEGLDEEK